MPEEAIVISGEKHVRNARILTLRRALYLEIQGMRGRFNAYQIIKKEFGYKGSKQKVYDQISKHIEENILPEAKKDS